MIFNYVNYTVNLDEDKDEHGDGDGEDENEEDEFSFSEEGELSETEHRHTAPISPSQVRPWVVGHRASYNARDARGRLSLSSVVAANNQVHQLSQPVDLEEGEIIGGGPEEEDHLVINRTRDARFVTLGRGRALAVTATGATTRRRRTESEGTVIGRGHDLTPPDFRRGKSSNSPAPPMLWRKSTTRHKERSYRSAFVQQPVL